MEKIKENVEDTEDTSMKKVVVDSNSGDELGSLGLEKEQKSVDYHPPRQILPRASKTNHRVIQEVAAPAAKDTNPNTRSRKGTLNNH